MPKKQIQWGNIPMKGEEYADKLTIHKIAQIENGINAKESGQFYESRKIGGKSVIDKLNKKNKKTGHWRKLGDSKIGVPRDEETKKKLKDSTKDRWRPVLQFTKDGKLVKEWPNFTSIKEELGFNHTNICACCQNRPKHKSAYGFIWKYKK